MDKETLSNYGWIVICVLVLAVMIALASPFGEFVSSAVKNTTAGLFDVNQEALGAAGIVIDDQSFADTNGGTGGSTGDQGGNAGGGYVDAEYTGGIDTTDLGAITWEQLIADSNDGSYATKYKVGNTLTLTMKDNSTAKFRIVGINHDDLTSGGKAHLTLVSEDTLVNHVMNSNSGNAGGWDASGMRTYLNGDYMNTMIPDSALSAIKEVSKKSFDYDTWASQTTSDKLWIPSFTEVGFNATQNSTVFNAEGGSAYAYFTDNASRTKTSTHPWWWLRSAYSSNGSYFCCVSNNGTYGSNFANLSYGVALGFCI